MWQIIQRVNKAPLALGSASYEIPEYVEPVLISFRIESVEGNEPGDLVAKLGQTVWFYAEFSDPDGIIQTLSVQTEYSLIENVPVAVAQRVGGQGYRFAISNWCEVADFALRLVIFGELDEGGGGGTPPS